MQCNSIWAAEGKGLKPKHDLADNEPSVFLNVIAVGPIAANGQFDDF